LEALYRLTQRDKSGRYAPGDLPDPGCYISS
jgi:hypothetical protein